LAISDALINPVVALFQGVFWVGKMVSLSEWVVSGVIQMGVLLIAVAKLDP
jgi:drug/metabolite transporter (DMT)-like permease